jgi:DNA-binding CsgD family transcriptional regulator
VARQLLRAVGGDGTAGPMDEWMLSWLARTADLLVGQAPQVAAELLREAVWSPAAGTARHDRLVSRLADALYRVCDIAGAEQVASQALSRVIDPDVLVDLHWTLAQCRIRSGQPAESLATLNRALDSPGISARHRARLLVLAARTHSSNGEMEKAGHVATTALAVASEAADHWAIAWALHVLTIVTTMEGRPADSLPLFDRALTVTEAEPALTDLRLLLQINKTVSLAALDRYEEAYAAAHQARELAGRVGAVMRLAQAQTALGQLFFDTGRWDDVMANADILDDDLKEPAAACSDLGIAAVICFHRGDFAAARDHLAAAEAHVRRIGNRVLGPLALARSLDHEHAGVLPEALGALTAGFSDSSEQLEEIEDLLADAARLAMKTGDVDTARALAGQAAALVADSQIPHRQANAGYCRGLLDRDTTQLLAAADRYEQASRPLLKAQALEAAAGEFIRSGDHEQARSAFAQAVDVYGSLGAAADVARLQGGGWDSLTPTETKIAALLEAGLSNPEIAAKLLLSRRTIATHVSHILKKLDVHSRTDIAREAALRTVAPR